jgi:hypothetical protein
LLLQSEGSVRIRWTKERFLSELKAVAERLGTTSASAFHKDPQGRRVSAAFSHHKEEWGFENWKEAVEAAGIDYTSVRIRWTKERFLSELKAVAERLRTTSASAFLKDPQGKRVYAAFSRHKEVLGFSSWQEAVEAASVTQFDVDEYPYYSTYWAMALVYFIAQELGYSYPDAEHNLGELEDIFQKGVFLSNQLDETIEALAAIKEMETSRDWEILGNCVFHRIVVYLSREKVILIYDSDGLEKVRRRFIELLPDIVDLLKMHFPGELSLKWIVDTVE